VVPAHVCPFFATCEAMEFAETRGVNRPANKLLMVLNALGLEYKKSIALIASSHHSCLF